jgi:hypothetical protein
VTSALALTVTLLLAAPPLPLAQRVEGARAVERARYAFVIGATRPFDEAYPRAVFERKVAREQAAELVLASEFDLAVTPELLVAEYDRIARDTRAPDQWAAIERALGGSRRMVEEVVCRPLLVDRALRASFAFDQRIHAVEHQQARGARQAFLDGGAPADAARLRLSRQAGANEKTDALLDRARVEAAGPKVLAPAGAEAREDLPIVLDPEMVRVLERELAAPGAVTTILEERYRFSAFRLVRADPTEWLVDGVMVSKRDFERWFDEAVGRLGALR